MGAIAGSFAHVLNLSVYGRDPRITHYCQLLGCGPGLDSATSAVVTDATAAVVRDIVVVEIVNPGGIYIRDAAVIVDSTVIPISAVIAATGISIAVIDVAVVTDVGTPVA